MYHIIGGKKTEQKKFFTKHFITIIVILLSIVHNINKINFIWKNKQQNRQNSQRLIK